MSARTPTRRRWPSLVLRPAGRAGLLSLLGLAACGGPGAAGPSMALPGQDRGSPRDLARLSAHPRAHHDQTVLVEGIVTSVCGQEGCFINLVPLNGKGRGVFVVSRPGGPKFPKDCVGKVARVRGRFYSKVTPRSRMSHWHGHGWRAVEARIPLFAELLRIDADQVTFRPLDRAVKIAQEPLAPHAGAIVDLRWSEFEAALMGARRQCLDPGEETPSRPTRRYHELLLALDHPLIVKRGVPTAEHGLQRDQAYYLPARTTYRVKNGGRQRGCFIMVYSLPEPPQHSH